MAAGETGAAPSIRLDKWLWYARFCKSRAIAAELVSGGAVRVNAQRVVKPSTAVRVGDGLSFAQGGRVRVLRIHALGTRRGPAVEAQTLYDDLDALADGRSPQTTPALEPNPEADT